jgi:hypothetical protein
MLPSFWLLSCMLHANMHGAGVAANASFDMHYMAAFLQCCMMLLLAELLFQLAGHTAYSSSCWLLLVIDLPST